MLLVRLIKRNSALLLMTMALPGAAFALGLGEIRGQAVLGQGLQLDIPLVGAGNAKLDTACFRLAHPPSTELPVVRQAKLSLRSGNPPVLQIRSDSPLRDPVTLVSVYLGCGHEISRDYVLMASPEMAGTVRPEAVFPTARLQTPPRTRSVPERSVP